jgi:hypothetical protein
MRCDQAGAAAAAARTELPQLLKLGKRQAWQEPIPALEGSKHLTALAAAGARRSCARGAAAARGAPGWQQRQLLHQHGRHACHYWQLKLASSSCCCRWIRIRTCCRVATSSRLLLLLPLCVSLSNSSCFACLPQLLLLPITPLPLLRSLPFLAALVTGRETSCHCRCIGIALCVLLLLALLSHAPAPLHAPAL